MMEINILKKKKFLSKNIHNAMCQNLMDRWQSMTSTWHHGYNYNGVALSCTVYMMNCNFATHANCPLALTTYKINEL